MKEVATSDIWAMMNKPLARKKVGGRGIAGRGALRKDPAMGAFLGITAAKGGSGGRIAQKKAPVVDSSLASWLGAGSGAGSGGGGSSAVPAKVVRLEDVIAGGKEAEAEAEKSAAKEVRKPGTGLEGVLGMVKGDKGAGVLDKTRDAWKGFKERDGEVANELDAYKKDKNRYTDKVAFLERTDRREWEADMARKKTKR